MTETVTQDVVVVDGSSYLFRAYHAMPPLTTATGEPTGALLGVINMLRKLQQDYPKTPIIVVFDSKEKTTRHHYYPEYKANRPPMAEELAVQIAPIHEVIKAMGLPLVVVPGIEADDIIGTLVAKAQAQNLSSLVVTGDKDLAQLVNARVTLLNTMNDSRLDEAGVIAKFGVPPDLIVDYLALMGDKVDNIPGIPKVGPKTAIKWLEAYGSLDGVVTHAEAIGGKVGESLRANLDVLPLSKQLVTIDCTLELPYQLQDLTNKAPDDAQLRALFERFEFSRWLAELSEVPVDAAPSLVYDIVTDQASFEAWLARLRASDLFAFDLETTSLNTLQAEIVGISFACTLGEAAYVPLTHEDLECPQQLDRATVLAQLKPLLENAQQLKVGQNIKYDMSVLMNHEITLQGIAFDTMLESYVLNSTATRHDMDSLALKYLDRNTIKFEDVAGKGKSQLLFNQIPVATAGPYAAEDAEVTLQLHEVLWPQLPDPLKTVLTDIDMPLVSVLSRMERQGVLLDAQALAAQSEVLEERLTVLMQQAHDLAGREFNLSSPKQLQAILFEEQKLPVLKKTPAGQPSTAEEVLQELAYDYPLPQVILEYRSLSKLKSTYTDKLPLQIDPTTQRVHTSYHQAVTATGRLSSSDPNLQNIPIRTALGRQVRQAFVAPKGYVLVAADYSQIELRIMAHLSEDESLLSAFAQGQDVHRATAAEVFGKSETAVTQEERRRAKAINFGLIYGMSAFGLAKQLGIARQQAQEYVDVYFERYPGVLAYMDRTREQAHAQGFVETLFGRRLYLPEINVRQVQRQKAAERTAINAPMQGTAADIIKKAMVACDAWLLGNPHYGRMIMQVHDELVFEIKAEYVTQAMKRLGHMMQTAAQLAVPLLVEVGYGQNWDEAH